MNPKLHYFGHLMLRANSLEKDPDAFGKRLSSLERLTAGGEGTTENEMVGWRH